jgi:intein/homing endonuclease
MEYHLDKMDPNKKKSLQYILDPKFYLENFVKIKTKEGGMSPFILNNAQKDLFNAVRNNSRVIILKSRQIGFCAKPDQKVLTADLRLVTLDDIEVGTEVIAVDENAPGGNDQARKMRTAIVEGKSEVRSEALRLTMSDGQKLVITPNHRMLSRTREDGRQIWKKAKDMEIGDGIRSIPHLPRPSRPVRQRFWEGRDLPGKRIGGYWPEVMRVEHLDKQRMIDLQTSESTYILEGFVSHNSTAMVGYFYHNTITTPGTTTAIIGYNSDLASELLDKIKTFYRTTPKEIQPTLHYNSKHELSFPALESKIMVLPSTEDVGRGYTIHNCLAEGTRIVMADWTTKAIEDVMAKDRIINGKGGVSEVGATKSKLADKKLVSIASYGSPALNVTEDHKVLTRDPVTSKPVWKKAGKLKKGDYLAYPYYQCRKRRKFITLPNSAVRGYETRSNGSGMRISIDKKLGLFLGWYLAEGNARRSNSGITFSIHKDEISEVLNVITPISHSIGSSIRVVSRKGSKSAQVVLNSKALATWLIENFGGSSWEKRLPAFVWKSGWEFGYALLNGLIKGDGYTNCLQSVTITTVSERLALQVKHLAVSLRLGLASVYKSKSFRYGKKCRDRYDVSIGGKGNYKIRRKLGYKLPIYNNGRARWRSENRPQVNQGGGHWVRGREYYWSRIKSVEELTGYRGKVYDIGLIGSRKDFLTESGVVHNCLLTEYAFWDKAEEKITTLESSVPANGKLVIESTPAGIGNPYHRIWMAPDNGYVKKEYGWWWHYTKEEIELIRKRMNNPRKFAQEYELEFLASGRNVFDQNIITEMRKNMLKPGQERDLGDGRKFTVTEIEGLRMYREPEVGHVYVVGVDTSEGVEGGDYSVATFFDRASGEEVAMYRGRIAPDRFADMLNRWGRQYNDALMVVEINNHGLTTITCLKNKVYPSLYFRPSKFELSGSPMSNKLGWKTTKMTRPYMLDDLYQAMRDTNIQIHSQETLDEMLTFIYDSRDNMTAMQGFNDDCLFSCAIALQGFKVTYHSQSIEQLDYRKYLPIGYSY